MQGRGSVASADELARTARHWFWAIWVLSQVIKAMIAVHLAPFGDEAFYWQESRALAWSYSDLPGATAWLIRLGQAFAGNGELGMRLPFLLLGSLIPLFLLRTGRYCFGARSGYQSGLLWMLLPLGASLGVLALPDVPLTFASVWALDALVRVDHRARWRDWLALGAALALAWLCHYRAAMLLAGGAVFVLLTRNGRALLPQPGLWLALAMSMLGLLPLLYFNATHAWAGFGFQLVDRHPWAFQADALIQPLEQAAVTTPILYIVILYALWICWQRRDADPNVAVLGASGISIVLAYFGFGLFADDLRFRLHWPLPGYVPALLALPVIVDQWRSRWSRATWRTALVLAASGSLVTMAYLALAAAPTQGAVLAAYKLFPDNFVGWHEATARTRKHLQDWAGDQPLLVADNFLLAAELDFGLRESAPFSLDHERNTKHGRAPQLRLWQRDEVALATHTGAPVLLVVEETAGSERDRADWQARLCRNIQGMRLLDRLSLYQGRKRFAWYSGQVGIADADRACTAGLQDQNAEIAQ